MLQLPIEGFKKLHEQSAVTTEVYFWEISGKARKRLDQLGQSSKGSSKKNIRGIAAVYKSTNFEKKENHSQTATAGAYAFNERFQ